VKKILITYNVLFLILGNLIFTNIHYLHDHGHNHNHHDHIFETEECQECINLENCNNSILDSQEVTFSNNNINLFELQYFKTIEFNNEKKYNPRAPPISL